MILGLGPDYGAKICSFEKSFEYSSNRFVKEVFKGLFKGLFIGPKLCTVIGTQDKPYVYPCLMWWIAAETSRYSGAAGMA